MAPFDMPRPYVMRLRRPRFSGLRTPVVTARQSAGRLVVVGLGAIGLVVLLWVVTTQTEPGQRLADLVLYGRVLAGPLVLIAARETLESVSLAMAAITALGLVTLALLRGGVGLMSAVIALLGGANVTTQLLKASLDRPNLLGVASYAPGNSFPSGHVTLTASLAFAAVLVAPRGLRTPVAIAAAFLTAAVGTSTITAGWHRLADVVGSILITLAWAAIPTGILVMARGWMPRHSWRRGLGHGATGVASFLGSAALLAGGLGLAYVLIAQGPLADAIAPGQAASRTFVAAVTISAGSAFLAIAAFLWAMRGVALEPPSET